MRISIIGKAILQDCIFIVSPEKRILSEFAFFIGLPGRVVSELTITWQPRYSKWFKMKHTKFAAFLLPPGVAGHTTGGRRGPCGAGVGDRIWRRSGLWQAWWDGQVQQ